MKTKTLQLQKKTAGATLWKEIKGNCTGPLSDFRNELQDFLTLNRWVRQHNDAQGRSLDRLCRKAEKILAAIDGLADDHVGFGVKFPQTPWDKCEPSFLTGRETVEYIEANYGPGYTSEPYVQVIQITHSKKTVMAEYAQGVWLDPLTAAGFK